MEKMFYDELGCVIDKLQLLIRQRLAAPVQKKTWEALHNIGVLSPLQLRVMGVLRDNGKQCMMNLAAMADASYPNMSRVVDDLIKLGYVQRYADDKNRRFVWVEILPKGHDNMLEYENLAVGIAKEVMDASYSQECQVRIHELSKALIEALECTKSEEQA
ncbi:MAG: MarR family winged helix-turn-helix transcriptional regulator [Clostridia bacterium]|nr:MarR family winged helix-turn-helix transcriptional regulator [Clostridia bacterium]